jgi:hypothetical protein
MNPDHPTSILATRQPAKRISTLHFAAQKLAYIHNNLPAGRQVLLNPGIVKKEFGF